MGLIASSQAPGGASARRVLIVSPRFPPVNAADMHRVRQSLPYLADHGWEPTILAVNPDQCEMPLDPWLCETVPPGTRVVHASALPVRVSQRVGLRDLALRSMSGVARAGNRLLASGAFSLVYLSTTAFPLMALGRYWQARHGVPYVLDLQDPWRSDYYHRPGAPLPPGGRLRHGLSQALARLLEPLAMRHAGHVISVSPAYPEMLARRYPWFDIGRTTVLPFGAPEADIKTLRRSPVRQSVFDPSDGNAHWVYVGRAGGDMALALRAFFLALREARQRHPRRYAHLRLHFVGTDYAPAGRERETVWPVAQACGVGDLVEERPLRIPYAEALQCMLDADALVVPGSDAPGYTASKLYPTILARKPLLAVFHEQSSVLDVLRETRAGIGVGFATGEAPEAIARRIGTQWFDHEAWADAPTTDWAAFAPYTAREMTRRQCAVFDRAVHDAAHPTSPL